MSVRKSPPSISAKITTAGTTRPAPFPHPSPEARRYRCCQQLDLIPLSSGRWVRNPLRSESKTDAQDRARRPSPGRPGPASLPVTRGQGQRTLKRVNDPHFMTKAEQSPLQGNTWRQCGQPAWHQSLPLPCCRQAAGWPPPHPSPTHKVTAAYWRLITDSKFK